MKRVSERKTKYRHEKTIALNGYTLPIQIEPLEEGGYLARSPVLRGFLVEGETVEQVLEWAPGVARALLEVMQERDIPLPRELRKIKFPLDVEILVPA
ncbi:MAG: type II toxin-antitoxin system HicB family antitoxin [Chloroflexi bacterium]|nr:type II toxin-antitoxin system HicB family antitoxin [Chloroflexota bacterium]